MIETTKLTDEEVICTWMEPRPASFQREAEAAWWPYYGTIMPERGPRTITLNECHEVEARLILEAKNPSDPSPCLRLNEYREELATRAFYPWHADAPTRIKALAAVLRSEAER